MGNLGGPHYRLLAEFKAWDCRGVGTRRQRSVACGDERTDCIEWTDSIRRVRTSIVVWGGEKSVQPIVPGLMPVLMHRGQIRSDARGGVADRAAGDVGRMLFTL